MTDAFCYFDCNIDSTVDHTIVINFGEALAVWCHDLAVDITSKLRI